jgi:RNA polymerase sigma-70 factor (ECF subfamily)
LPLNGERTAPPMLLFDEVGSVEVSPLDVVQCPRSPPETNKQRRTATTEVREAMLATLPSLRAFARSLTHNVDAADDLVQDAILRAWKNIEKFEPGTNLNAWLFTILRNSFLSQWRRARREVEDPNESYAGQLWTSPEQDGKCAVQDMLKALSKLPIDQREALLLIMAEGLSYEEAAQVCGVATGTIKSRVNRARERLARLLSVEDAERTLVQIGCSKPPFSMHYESLSAGFE